MPALIQCPYCQALARVADETAGREVRCPTCHNIFDPLLSAQAIDEAAYAADSPSSTHIQTNVTPPPRPPAFSANELARPDDFTDLPPRRETPFPGIVRAAGIIWIVFGALIVFAFSLVILVAAARSRGQVGQILGGLVCGGSLIATFAGGFIFVGVQTVRGTARDTLGNGIGSILFAAIIGASMIAPLMNVRGDAGFQIVAGSLTALEITGLFLGGVFALLGRSNYKAWRREHRPSRRQLDRDFSRRLGNG